MLSILEKRTLIFLFLIYNIGMHIGPYSEIWDENIPETEQPDPTLKGLDLRSNTSILRTMLDSQTKAIQSIEAALPALSSAADAIVTKLSDPSSRLIHGGAGSSGLLAMQDAMELNPTFDWPLERQVFLMAGGDKARLTPIGPEEDNIRTVDDAVKDNNICNKDVVIIVAASGTTPFSVRLLKAANKVGALTISIANNPDTELLNLADHGICLKSGPEIIAGSTRLAAGTAQKAALGMLSSLIMTRLGHVIDGFMVNMVANNQKLYERASRIVASISQCSLEKATNALDETKGAIKPAILVCLGLNQADAKIMLEKTGGDLRHAMEGLV